MTSDYADERQIHNDDIGVDPIRFDLHSLATKWPVGELTEPFLHLNLRPDGISVTKHRHVTFGPYPDRLVGEQCGCFLESPRGPIELHDAVSRPVCTHICAVGRRRDYLRKPDPLVGNYTRNGEHLATFERHRCSSSESPKPRRCCTEENLITGETRKRIGHVSWRKSRVSNRVYGMQLEREDESGSGIVDNVTCSASGLNHVSIAYPNFRYHVDAGASGAALS